MLAARAIKAAAPSLANLLDYAATAQARLTSATINPGLNLKPAGTAITAVSYTHLDVYKRQQ